MIKLDFSKARVLVVGDLMLDQYWHGATSRISPEAPVPVVHVKRVQEVPGGAANVALNCAALGAQVALLGLVGVDEAAHTLKQLLVKHQISCHFIALENLPTTRKLRILSQAQQLIRLDTEDNPKLFSHHLLEDFKRLIEDCDVVILADYNKGALEDTQGFIELAKNAGKSVLVDPKRPFASYRGAYAITPNLREFEQEAGACLDEASLIQKAQAKIAEHELDALIITRAEKGLSIITKDGKASHLPAHAKEVFDITGAGDTVIAVMGAYLASHPDALLQAANLGNVAAGIVVGKTGTASVGLSELEAALQAETPPLLGEVTESELLYAMRVSQAQGERLIFTNGCFDILHAGHVQYLTEARALGDRLIVAVNTDDSIRRLKGPMRPINPLRHRMAVLAGLKAVDWVIAFDEDTPERLIQALKPDALVKGGDYQDKTILPGAQFVLSQGGAVELLSLTDDCSSTQIIETILERHSSPRD